MDVRYRISESVVVTGTRTAALSSPPLRALPLDFKLFKIQVSATKARGSCGVDPGPLAIRLRAVILSVSSMGDRLYGVRKRLMFVLRSLMFSAFAMLSFIALAVSRSS